MLQEWCCAGFIIQDNELEHQHQSMPMEWSQLAPLLTKVPLCLRSSLHYPHQDLASPMPISSPNLSLPHVISWSIEQLLRQFARPNISLPHTANAKFQQQYVFWSTCKFLRLSQSWGSWFVLQLLSSQLSYYQDWRAWTLDPMTWKALPLQQWFPLWRNLACPTIVSAVTFPWVYWGDEILPCWTSARTI